MALGIDDEFDYLDDEFNLDSENNEPLINIKGSKEENNSVVKVSEEVKEEIEESPKVDSNFDSIIFIVKVTSNKEDKAMEMVVDKVVKKDVNIYAIARPHGLRGYVLIESPDRENAEEAVYNLPYVKGILPKQVSYEEVKQMLEPVASEIKIEKSDVVEIIGEPFKNEKAKVIRVDKQKGEAVVSLLGAAVPIPVTVKLDNLRVIRREDLDEE
ncbi:MAG: transcription elongation factor Spt5 [Candidatus Nanoarchaeia archaeon]|jgi:transcriptional antiterminator NusG|nr:transcription elongation factor Spt5 [Candidatus Nanoarchaeia archaeon]MDD3993706.1 transcription elongation factor Spt5 [Candidatus Nanoarchaeia archaeon]MDD4563739.1 transcription elongation factor Spt5 [Candidatus Nanoarchaeia archaeon]